MMKNKKLLILGATTETIFLVRKAESLGIETYVADPLIDAPAKRFSSHPIDVDCFDKAELLKLIKAEGISGILPGCADILVPVYQELCEETGLPCYVNKNIVYSFGNKKGLKEILSENGLPTIEEYSFDEVFKKDFNKYPVFIKPTDNNSSKGMSIAYCQNDFTASFKKALDNSRSKTVIIEKLMTADDFFVGYVLRDGEAFVTFTADRFVNSSQRGVGSITNAIIYPSKYTELYFSNVHKKMLKIFKKLGFKNGILHIQGFVDEEGIKFYDPALRITGGQEYLLMDKIYSFDLLKSLIYFAIGKGMGEKKDFSRINCKFGGAYACNLAFSVKQSIIGFIDGVDYAKNHPNVINVTQEHFSGDTIDKIGTAQQNIFRMHLITSTREQMRDTISDLQKNVIAYDSENNNIMLDGLDADAWYETGGKK